MTTPREDAIAALAAWATIVVASYRRGDLPVGEIDSLDEAVAALGAEAETPDLRAAVDAGYREGYRAAEGDIAALGAEAETPTPWRPKSATKQAIVAAYTEWIGAQLLRAIEVAA